MTNTKECPSTTIKEEIMVYHFRAYVSPILALIGIPSNLFVLIVFVRIDRELPGRFNLYAIYSSIVHNLQLITNTFLDDFLGRGLKWLTNCTFWITIDSQSVIACKLLTYLIDASALCAALILMLFSIDRVCTIYFPEHFKQSSYVLLTHLLILLLYLISFLLDIPNLLLVNLTYKNETNCQYINPSSVGVNYVLFLYIVGAVILPSLFIFITNIIILIKLGKAIYERKLIGQFNTQLHNEFNNVIVHLFISLLFSFFSLPLIITIILRQQVDLGKISRKYAKIILHLTKLFSSLDSVNHSFDFFIYFLFMPSFRQNFYDLFKCRRNTDNSDLKFNCKKFCEKFSNLFCLNVKQNRNLNYLMNMKTFLFGKQVKTSSKSILSISKLTSSSISVKSSFSITSSFKTSRKYLHNKPICQTENLETRL